jgi:hypothetical protein
MYELLNRIRKLEAANLVPEEHLALLHEMAYDAENKALEFKREKFPEMEMFFGYKYVIVKELIKNLESLAEHG